MNVQTQRNSTSRNSQSRPRGGFSIDRCLSAVILGIFLLIAASSLGGRITALTEQLKSMTFSDVNTFSSPSELVITDKTYMTETEAAEYLNLTSDKIVSLLTSGEIKNYVKTQSGYSIAKTALDKWFDNEAYQAEIENNSEN
ncbi:MAG: excisionase family DNA-binding protein [Ruminococcus sp.]|jgi:excisionase family DNA binding protein|nr:excisionase family DNA-binding protein [Ruminococcus sp.]